jgi:hypothetical protein
MSRAVTVYIVGGLGMIIGAVMMIVGLVFIYKNRGERGDVSITLPRNLGQVNHAPEAVVVLVFGAVFFFTCGWALIELPEYPQPTVGTPKPRQINLTQAASPRPSASSSTRSDPASVVKRYYEAINAHDYGTAWDLGGEHLGRSYGTFVAGFADTRHDTLTILAVDGGTVRVRLTVERTDARRAVFEGTYAVKQGEIIAASLHPA